MSPSGTACSLNLFYHPPPPPWAVSIYSLRIWCSVLGLQWFLKDLQQLASRRDLGRRVNTTTTIEFGFVLVGEGAPLQGL